MAGHSEETIVEGPKPRDLPGVTWRPGLVVVFTRPIQGTVDHDHPKPKHG